MTPSETEDGVSSVVAAKLRGVALMMGAGLTMMAGLIAWSYANTAAKLPSANEVRTINLLTIVTALIALFLIVASEVTWRAMLRRSSGALSGRVQKAYITRLGCREAAALLGMTVAYLAAINGVLRAYPAYWVNLVPFALFLGFLAAHWPTTEELHADARGALGENPVFSKK